MKFDKKFIRIDDVIFDPEEIVCLTEQDINSGVKYGLAAPVYSSGPMNIGYPATYTTSTTYSPVYITTITFFGGQNLQLYKRSSEVIDVIEKFYQNNEFKEKLNNVVQED